VGSRAKVGTADSHNELKAGFFKLDGPLFENQKNACAARRTASPLLISNVWGCKKLTEG
jgi:hypothetical protein